jgi:hypothetical protein
MLAEEEARLAEEAARLGEEEEMLDAVTLTAAALRAQQLDRCRASLASAFQRLATIFHRRSLCLSLELPHYAAPSSPSPCIHCQACGGPTSSNRDLAGPLAEDSNVYDAMLNVLALPPERHGNASVPSQRLSSTSLLGGLVETNRRYMMSA